MKRGFNLKSELKKLINKNIKKRFYLALIIIAIAIFIYVGYFFIYNSEKCENLRCFQNALKNCKKVWFIREDSSAAWRYEILKSHDENICDIKVVLLKMLEGNIQVEGLQGKSMVCEVYKSGDKFPEKDMSRCSGILKEELQEVLIQKMHNYLLENIGKIKKEFKEV